MIGLYFYFTILFSKVFYFTILFSKVRASFLEVRMLGFKGIIN